MKPYPIQFIGGPLDGKSWIIDCDDIALCHLFVEWRDGLHRFYIRHIYRLVRWRLNIGIVTWVYYFYVHSDTKLYTLNYSQMDTCGTYVKRYLRDKLT